MKASYTTTAEPTAVKKKSKVRWVIAGLMWAAIAINYIDRTVLSAGAPHIEKAFHLTEGEMGILMSGFFWSYALFQIPAGYLAEKIGQKKALGFSVGWWSLFTALTGVATGFKSILGFRVGLGIGEAGAYPSNAGITKRWFPKKERATVSGLFDSGSKFGGAVAMPLIAWMIVQFDWRKTFMIVGLLGIIWTIIWLAYYKDQPKDHKGVNKYELEYIAQDHEIERTTEIPMKWYQLLKYKNIWAMCIGFFMINYNSYFFITWLPTYLVKERGMNLMTMGFAASAPLFAAMILEILAGICSDKLYATGRFSITFVRKLFIIIGLIMASFIGLAAFTDNVVLAIVLLCVAKSGNTIAASQVWSLPGDVSPNNMTSIVAGMQNTVSNMGGVVGPIITGFIVTATGSFVPALLFSAVLIIIAIVNYLFLLGKVEQIKVD